MKRMPAVAGQFYPGTQRSLHAQMEAFINRDADKEKVIGVMSPHAGYMYSGGVAGALFSTIIIPPVVIILGPNHRGAGSEFAIMTEGSWISPLGETAIDEALGKRLLKHSNLLEEDIEAHAHEHSLEVQLPFLQYLRPDVRIVPICIGGRNQAQFIELGEEIAACTKEMVADILIVASSDMSHYEPHETAKRKDSLAIDAILELDEKKMLSRLVEHGISMCGYGPTASMITAAKKLGAKKAELVRYQTSGDTSGDYSQVVGYAGIVVY